MATDPNQLMQVLLGTIGQQGGILQAAQNNAQASDRADQQLALGAQQQTLNGQKIAANDHDAQQQQQYDADTADWVAKGSPTSGLQPLIVKYPKYAQAMQDVWKGKSAEQAEADIRAHGSVYSALNAGATDVAIAELQARRNAEARTGTNTDELDQHLAELRSGNPQAIAAVKGWAQANLASAAGALGKPDLAKAAGVDYDFSRYKTLGSNVLDAQTGAITPGPEQVEYKTVKNGDGSESIVKLGGGGQSPTASGSTGGNAGPVGGRTAYGWTPRASNGGNNTDAAVDAKNAGMSKALGVGVDQPFPPGTTPAQVYHALTLSEGGPGTLADRNNNHGNLTDPKTGAYRKFDTPGAGDAAGIAQVARNMARGQNTIRTMVEGLPAGGGKPSGILPSASAGVTTNGAGQVVYTSQPKGGAIPGNPDLQGPAYLDDLRKNNVGLANQVQAVLDTRAALPPATARSPAAQALRSAVTQAEPGFDDQAYARRKKTIAQYTPGSPGPGTSMLSAATLINHVYDMAEAAQNLPDHTFSLQNKLSNWGASATNQPYLIKYNEGRKFVASELPKFLNGKAPTEGEIDHNYNSYDPSMGASGIKTALGTDIDYLYGRYQPLVQAYKDQTGKDLSIDSYAPGKATTAKAAALQYYRQQGTLPHVVQTPAQAAALPKGTPFVTPDGRVKVR